MRNLFRPGISTLALLLASGTILVAQQTTGRIHGKVTESNSGRPKPGVNVTLRNLSTNLTRQIQTDAEGAYRFSLLPVGRYKVTFESSGRSYSLEAGVALGVDSEIATFKFPTEASVTVEVIDSSANLAVNSTSAETGVNVNSEILKDLPVLSRNVIEAAVLAPGVQIVQGSNVDPTKKASSYISNGEGQGRGTNFTVDGADNNSTDVGGYVSNIPLDAIGEFQVVTNQYKAEFGRSNAGFFNVITKSGGNEFAGVLNAQLTNQALRALKTDEHIKQDNRDMRLGGVVSGPIIKDKLFFMMSVERQDAEEQPFVFPPDAVAAFPALGSAKTKTKATTFYGKLDYAVASNLSLALTLGWDKNDTPNQAFPNTGRANGRIDPGMLGDSKNETKRIGLKSTYSVGALAWESVFNYFDYTNGIDTASGYGNGTPIQVRAGIGLPSSQQGRLGADPNAFQNTGIKRFQWRNDFTYAPQNHIIKGGFDFQQSKYADQHLFFKETGIYQFWTDLPYSNTLFSSGFDPAANYIAAAITPDGFQSGDSFKQYGVYIQDDWELNSNWSVYVGLRADKDTVFDFMGKYGDLYQQIHAANPAFLTSNVPENRTYVSPRFSVIFKPNGDDSLVFRAGYGQFVANTIDNVVGFSRALGNRANGLPNGGELAYLPNAGSGGFALGSQSVTSYGPGLIFFEDGSPFLINGHQLNLPAALTPYNYVNNVGGLRDYFKNTVNGWLTPASYSTAGKNLINGDFRYPTTDQGNIAITVKWAQFHTLDMNLLYSRTKNATVQYTTDESGPAANSVGPGGVDMGDNIFRSNQTSRSMQLQVKYSYVKPKTQFYFNLVAKENKSSYGGSAGSFDASGAADFYGGGATVAYATGAERRSAGTENFLGSMSLNHRLDIGTQFGVLASWHSGKAYDVTLGYAPAVSGGSPTAGVSRPTIYNPNPVLGFQEGRWQMDLGLRVSHNFHVNHLSLEPFLQVSNLLNNYDYGSNYDGAKFIANSSYTSAKGNPNFGVRKGGYQINQPRTAAFGVRITF